MKKLLILVTMLLATLSVIAQSHLYKGRYTNSSDIMYIFDGKHVYKGRYTNTSDIIYTFDGIIPFCFFVIL